MLRATSAIVRPSSMTNSTALALYSSVKRRRVDPIAQPLPVGPAELHHCPLNRERSRHTIVQRSPRPHALRAAGGAGPEGGSGPGAGSLLPGSACVPPWLDG